MATLDELFAQGAKEVYQDVWTDKTDDIPEDAPCGPGYWYRFVVTVSHSADGLYSAHYQYVGWRNDSLKIT